MMTALPAKVVGRLKGVQPSAGSALISGSGAEAVELTSAAMDGPKPACMTVYDCPSAPPPYIPAKHCVGVGAAPAPVQQTAGCRHCTLGRHSLCNVLHVMAATTAQATLP